MKPPSGDALVASTPRYDHRRPNILMLFSDEHHWAYSGYAGHHVVETPNLDRLAARSVNFRHAYCNSPLCSPSRHSFMAGLWNHRIGCWNNTSSFPENTVTWAHALSAAGYETSLVGKMHFNGYQKMYGFDRRPVLEGDNAGNVFHSWGIRCSHDWSQAMDGGGGGLQSLLASGPDSPERQPIFQHDERIRDGTLQLLREKAAQGDDAQPWAICMSSVLPHPPFTARQDLWDHYAGRARLPEDPFGADLDEVDRALRRYHELDRDGAYGEAEILRCQQAYYGLITEYDEHVGMVLDELERSGLAENTVVLYFSDHGEFAGEHGLIGKVSLRESSIRVPLLVSWPGHYREGTTVDTPVSLVDIYPTLLDIAEYQLPDILPLDGHSLLPFLTGDGADFAGDVVFGEFEGEGWPHPRCFLREGELKYVRNHGATDALYNVVRDYHERDNLLDDPEHSKDGQRLRALIDSFWDAETIELEVRQTQERQKLAFCKNVAQDLGW